MAEVEVRYRAHAVQRMAERGITTEDIRAVLNSGVVIEDYPADLPYPSRLMLGFKDGRPLHVVAAEAADARATIIITVFEPDEAQWDSTFQRRVMP
ncbi:MAG: DUF4258 domain-containing protein [Actinomycetota bacterium]